MSDKNETDAAYRAIKRAAASARKRAARYDVPLAIWKDGKIVFLSPEQMKAQQDVADQPAAVADSNAN